MATYPMTLVSRNSRVVPDKGIRAKVAEDGTLIFRNDRGETAYQIEILHEWITRAQFDAILAFFTANGYANHDVVDLKGDNYTATFTNEPAIVDHRGSLLMVQSSAIGVKA